MALKFAKYANTNTNLPFQTLYLKNEESSFDYWSTILNEIRKVYGKFG